MGIGAINLDVPSAVTRPSRFPLGALASLATGMEDHGLYASILYPGFDSRGRLWSNGVGPMAHVRAGTVGRTGLLAPFAALTAVPGGDRATLTVDLNGATITSGYTIDFYGPDGTIIFAIILLSALDGESRQRTAVKIQATDGDTWEVIQDIANGRSTDQWVPGTLYGTWPSALEVSAVNPASEFITFRVVDYGAAGNAYFVVTNFGASAITPATGTTFFSGGSDAGGDDPVAGTYGYAWGTFRLFDAARSAISPVAQVQQIGDGQVDLSGMSDSLLTGDFKEWWRTQPKGETFNRGERIAMADTTDTDDVPNATLARRDEYDPRVFRSYGSGYIHRSRYVVAHDGRWFGIGHVKGAKYAVGTAQLVHESRVAVLAAPALPTSEFEHWTFRRIASGNPDGADDYRVIAVDASTRALYLDRAYEGASESAAVYELVDERDPFLLHEAVQFAPNQTGDIGTDFETGGIVSSDPFGGSGLFSTSRGLVITTRTGLWMLTGTSRGDRRLEHLHEGSGCLSHQGIVEAEDGTLFFPSARGFVSWIPGTGEPAPLSSPPLTLTGGEPVGIERTYRRINLAYAHNIVGHYSQAQRLIRWFVPLDGARHNTHAIVLDLKTKRWSVDPLEGVTVATTVTDGQGSPRTLLGDLFGNILEADVDTVSDGVYGITQVRTATGQTLRTITVASAGWTVDAFVGLRVPIVSPAGDFVTAVVASNTTDTLTFLHDLDSVPTAGSRIVLGGIHRRMRTGWFKSGDPTVRKIFEALRLSFTTRSRGQFFVSFAVDGGSLSTANIVEGDASLADGEEIFWARVAGKKLMFQIDDVDPEADTAFEAAMLRLRIPDEVPV